MRMMRIAFIALGVVLLMSCLGFLRVLPGLRRHHQGPTGELGATLVHDTRGPATNTTASLCTTVQLSHVCHGLRKIPPGVHQTCLLCVHDSIGDFLVERGGGGRRQHYFFYFVFFSFMHPRPPL